jgi:hypothetical protein
MSEGRTAAGAATAAQRLSSGIRRVARAGRGLPSERRQAALAAFGLFVTLFLPWYQETVIANGKTLRQTSATLTGWSAFSFVEAAVLLVAAGVLTLLFQRAEGKAFHLPGGDGGVIAFAGFWTCVLIIWRIFDKQGTSGTGVFATTSGIEWGIFVALAVAAFLAYSGNRIRAAHTPEPPLPGERHEPVPTTTPAAATPPPAAVTRPVATTPPPAVQPPPTLKFNERTTRVARRPAEDEQLTIPLDPEGD